MKPGPGGPWTLLALCLGIALTSAGCKSTPKGAGDFAEVVIEGSTDTQIREAIAEVFQAEGFTPVAGGRGLAFERRGTSWEQLAYGSWFDSGGVKLRLKMTLAPLGPKRYRLACKAYRVRDAGDLFFEEPKELPKRSGGPYQAMLENVARRLQP